MSDLEPVRPPFNLSAEADRLVSVFASLDCGKLLSYGDVTKSIGEDVLSVRGRSITNVARKVALREHKIVIVCVKSQGFLRVTEKDKISVTSDYREKIRRAVARGIKVADSIDTSHFNGEDITRYTLEVAYIGALKQGLRPGIASKIAKAIENKSAEVNTAYVLRLMSEGK